MHYVVLERLSRRQSYLHSLDGRAKILALLAVLVAISTTVPLSVATGTAYGALLGLAAAASALPVGWLLKRAATVLPFSAVFALLTWWTRGPEAALSLLAKTYLSAFAVLLVVASTPMPSLMDCAARLGVPPLLGTVIQFLYRYLFVIVDEGHRMWSASLLRGSGLGRIPWPTRARAGAGALAVLFARSMHKARHIHMAMLTRGFTGSVPAPASPRLRRRDVAFLAAALVLVAAARMLIRLPG